MQLGASGVFQGIDEDFMPETGSTLAGGLFRYTAANKLVQVEPEDGFDDPRLDIGITSTGDRQKLPSLNIKITGPPVFKLLRSYLFRYLPADERNMAREEARILLDAIAEELKMSIHAVFYEAPNPGGPPNPVYAQAAFLKEHCGWTLPKIADVLCPKKVCRPHKTGECTKRIAAGIRNYWRSGSPQLFTREILNESIQK